MVGIRFHIEEYKIKTPYTIVFIVTCSRSTNPIEIEYTGPDLNIVSANSGIQNERMESLKRAFQQEFGSGPFDPQKIKESIRRKSTF
mgnify:CR=1 FL=1